MKPALDFRLQVRARLTAAVAIFTGVMSGMGIREVGWTENA